MDNMCEDMATVHRCVKVVVKIVNMHIAIAETPPRCDVEVANDLVDSKAPLYSTTLFSLGVQSFAIMLSLTLFHVIPSSKSPRLCSISLPNFIASIATA